LAEAICSHEQSPYKVGRLMLVRHPADTECVATVHGYQALLRPDDSTFMDMPLDRLVDTWSRVAVTHKVRKWLADFRLRYLDLSASEDEWQHR
jgi:hypothetical protein